MTANIKIPSSPKWLPEVGSVITAHLPAEVIRVVVERYKDEDTMFARLSVQHPYGKGHNYRFRQLVKLQRKLGQPAGDMWVADE